MAEIDEIKEKLNSNLSSDNKNIKYIDILFHLKENMKNTSSKKCSCNTDDKYYCIPCKITCCSLCSLKEHESHIVINIKEYFLDMNNINKLFNNFSENITKSELVKNPNDIRQKIIKYIDVTIDEIINELNLYRKKQKENIENIFKAFDKNKNSMKENIDNIHLKLNEYVNKTKKFYNLNNSDKNEYVNKDNYNTYFLHGYDLLNLANQNMNKIYKYIDTLEDDLRNYLTNQNENLSKIKAEIDKLFSIENKNNKDRKSINLDQDIFDLAKPVSNFMLISDNLTKDNFTNIKERLTKYFKHIKNFKKIIYKAFSKTGNLKEIEHNIKSIEQKKLKGPENLFCLREQDKFNLINSQSAYSITNKKSINSEDDICLNHPLINKYYSLLFIDLFEKNFKVTSKQNQSSYADLQIWKKDNNNSDDEDEIDFAKIIEGTNEIHIYEKKIKKWLNFL